MDCTVSRRENISNLEGWNWLRAKARVLSATQRFSAAIYATGCILDTSWLRFHSAIGLSLSNQTGIGPAW